MITINKFKIDPKTIIKTYTGKIGCMCGCNGKYSYSSAHRDLGSTERGYGVKDSEVSDRAVNMMANRFNKEGVFKADIDQDTGRLSDYVYRDDGGRMKVIYFIKGTLSDFKKSDFVSY